MTVGVGQIATRHQQASESVPDLAPEEIEPAFAPRPRDSVVSTRLGDEVLIVDSNTGRMHVLNTTAALVWECFDGEVSLDELAAALADGFQVPLETVRADTVEMTRELGRLGLVAGISQPIPEAAMMTGPLQVGEKVEVFPLIASDGTEVHLPRPGEATLLVNWSPFCGYCAKIGADLAQSRLALADQGVALALVTVGTPEQNESILVPHGLSDVAFYRAEVGDLDKEMAQDPFGLLGTPVAYLIDASGAVSEPLAYGSVDVPALARRAGGLPADDGVESGARGGEEPSAGPRRTLPAASGVCGPSSGQGVRKTRQWAVTSAYAIGDFHVGIRADSAATDELLARAFATYRLSGDTSASDNFSVVLAGAGASQTKALSLLLAGDSTKVRSRSPRRILCALRSQLSALLEADKEGLIVTTNVAALVGDEAVLLPPIAGYWMEYLQARLARLDIRLSDEPHALIDPDKRELVIPEPRVEIDTEVLAELGDFEPSRTELATMEPGRYRLSAWTFEDEPSDPSPARTLARAVVGILPAITGSPDQLEDSIAALVRVLEETRAVPLAAASQQELMKSIEERVVRSSLRVV